MNDLILNFPEGFEPRSKQTKALKAIETAFQKGKKFVIVHADTGVGKTHLAKTLGNVCDDVPDEYKKIVDNYRIFSDQGADLADEFDPFGCYALTITKSLQDQYENVFNDTGVMKGKSNYQCQVDDSLTVDVAPCIYLKSMKNDCWKSNTCHYYNARNNMLKSKFSALNYSMFFSLPEHLKKRQVLVCDEGSELEEQLVGQFTCEVDITFLMKTKTLISSFPNENKKSKILSWIGNLIGNVEENLLNYEGWFSKNPTNKNPVKFNKKKGEYTRLTNLKNSLGVLMETYYDSEYIVERLDQKIRFIPLKVDVLSKHLFDCAEKVVILSATIIDSKSYCDSLGIDNYEYIHVGTDFDPKNAPIHIMAKQKLNYSNLKSMLPKLVEQIEGIMEHHSDHKGIIHTHTQYITDYIRDNIDSDRLLCREAGVRNEDLLKIHEESDEPTILVSPSMTYGVDLYDDLGRFQIILKAPWLPTKDVRVEKMMKIDKMWYVNSMLKTLVQASGRIIRSKDDKGETYILDGAIYDAISRNKKKLPTFFLERFN